MVVAESLLDLTGNTDLLRLFAIETDGGAAIWGKLEHRNPTGSIADRVALGLIRDGERRGALLPNGVVVEATTGALGIALAFACIQTGHRLVVTMPESTSLEVGKQLEALGAKVVLTSHEQGMSGAIAEARAIADRTEGAFAPCQYDNEVTRAVHARTAHELLGALHPHELGAVVVGVGTGATVSGIGRALRDAGSRALVIAVEPESSASISRNENGRSRIQGLGSGTVPRLYDASVVSEVRTVRDEDAWEMRSILAKKAGVLVGVSAGAAAFAARTVAGGLAAGEHVVAILPDTGERYFSTEVFFSKES